MITCNFQKHVLVHVLVGALFTTFQLLSEFILPFKYSFCLPVNDIMNFNAFNAERISCLMHLSRINRTVAVNRNLTTRKELFKSLESCRNIESQKW